MQVAEVFSQSMSVIMMIFEKADIFLVFVRLMT
jgi:hypothetical protein